MKFFLLVSACFIDSSFLFGYMAYNVDATADVMKEWLEIPPIKLQGNINKTRDLEQFIDDEVYSILLMFFKDKVGVFSSSLSVGGIIGSMYSLNIVTKFGRKRGLLMSTFINFFAALFLGYSKYFNSVFYLFVGRICYGIKCGINLVVSPIYVVEIVPAKKRPRYTVAFMICMPIGALVAKIIGSYIGTRDYWPLVHSLGVITAIFQLVILPSCPESPKYLYVMKGNELECRKALMWLRGPKYNEEELHTIRREFYQRKALGEVTLKTIIENEVLRHALTISVVMMISHQICGINGMISFYHKNYTDRWNLTMLLLILGGLISLSIINVISRRKILITTFIIKACATLIVSISCAIQLYRQNNNMEESQTTVYVIQVIVHVYLFAFQLGIASMVFVLPAEMFTTTTLPYAFAIGSTCNWLFDFVMSVLYLPIQRLLGYLGFLNFTMTNLMFAHFVYTMIPTTDGKDIKEVYHLIYSLLQNRGAMT